MNERQPTILVVDDMPQNVRLLEALLVPLGYTVLTATNGHEALQRVAEQPPDVVLLDIVMPEMDGHEVCKRLRENPETRLLPIVMLTASPDEDRVKALEAGADDFIVKPFNRAELLARVKSLLRIKQYHDTIQRQSAELAELNRTLEARVREQVGELEGLGRLRRFLSPQVAEVVASDSDALLQPHRREITVVSCDLRGFTPFVETAEPEEVMQVLREYHEAAGELIFRHEGTVKDITGDGVMVLFNDPLPAEDHTARAVRMAVAMRERVGELCGRWQKRGYELAFAVGVARGYATLGRTGFEGRFDYGAVGTVVNLAARLCAAAKGGQVLIGPRVHAAVEDLVDAEPIGELTLKGLSRPVRAYSIRRLRAATAS